MQQWKTTIVLQYRFAVANNNKFGKIKDYCFKDCDIFNYIILF